MEVLDKDVAGDITSGGHLSYWLEDAVHNVYSGRLNQNIHADVVIVGGGLAGITVAYCLSKSGKRVAVIEDGYIGSGETGRTTAQLVTALDDRYSDLEKIYGEADTKLIAESHMAAINLVEEICLKEKIDCDFRRVNGYLFLHPSDDKDELKKECFAATRAGIKVQDLDSIPGMLHSTEPCLEFPDQAQFHPIKYLEGLCEIITQHDGKIFTLTHAHEIDHTGITTNEGFRVNANHVVVATNSPVNNLAAMHLKQTSFRTYVVAGLVKKNALPYSLWWDTGDHHSDKNFPPYHYVRLAPYNKGYDLLISGGEDHPTGDIRAGEKNEEIRYKNLEDWTLLHFPVEQVLYHWSGQVIEPTDSLAFIGRNPLDKENVYIVTGDSGTGMTHGTIAGMLIPDLIKGRKNPYEAIYRPSRVTLKSGNMFF
ncbi:MAG: FAD-binding oxidoreductase [Saprospiraceae bacterium]